MTRKQKRLTVIACGMAFLLMATGLTLYALGQRTSYFRLPSDLIAQPMEAGVRFRLGGLVEDGSVAREQGTKVSFGVTDKTQTVKVVYDGILPDLFREGQGIITEGVLGTDGVFVADHVLAKHDETYMPKDVADSLKAKGVWQPEEKAKP
ncbi:MAG: cytochrome c maturation protein CcmE [Mesorhizobium sp.]